MIENKKYWLILTLVIGLMFGVGIWSGTHFANIKNIYNLAKLRNNMIVDRATVKSIGNGKYTFTTNKGPEKLLDNTKGIFISILNPAGGYLQADWSMVQLGTKVQIATEKATGKIRAVLIL
jgi:hypothetical protein